MFRLEPPRVRDLEVFTRLPDRYREPRVTSWSRANRGGAAIDSFLEAPVFDEAGNLFVGDIPNGRVFRIDAAGEWDLVLQYDGEPNGMKFAAPGEIVIADYRNGLMRLDVARGTVAEVRAATQQLLEIFADTPCFILNAGCAIPPDRPGLGLEWDEAALAHHAADA